MAIFTYYDFSILFLLSSMLVMVMNAAFFSDGVEQFTEELLLKPLPDRKVLAHFYFENRAPPASIYGRHHHLFPKAIYQLVQKFQIKEMELSFTQGRWNYERWGGFDPIANGNAKPPGVELWVVFDVPQNQVDAYWKNLTHALSGLFCASINFLESSTTYSAPHWGFHSFTGSLRYGSLPREAVCTENLTPWLKLLPCRDKAGLAALMDRHSIYNGFYHSQRLHLHSSDFNSVLEKSGTILEQVLSIVLQPDTVASGMSYYTTQSLQPSWSLSGLFGRKVGGRCVSSNMSRIYLLLDTDLVHELKKLNKSKEPGIYPAFELSVVPNRVIEEDDSLHGKDLSIFYEFLIEKNDDSELFDLQFTWNDILSWRSPQPPLSASRFLTGSGNERGAIAMSFKFNEPNQRFMGSDTPDEGCMIRVNLFQVVPWYVKVYFHTLQVFVDEKPQLLESIIEKAHIIPSKDKLSPGLMEMALKFPCGIKLAALTFEFDKGFLHINEYPPDANQGFDIPSAVVSFPDLHTSMHFLCDNNLEQSSLLSKLQERSTLRYYTEVLLVPLTTPDFSMPYNVITLTCTVSALYFGSLLNVLTRRSAEEERILQSQGRHGGKLSKLLMKISAKLRRGTKGTEAVSPPSSESSSLLNGKLIFKVIFVAVVAVIWHYLSY